ncbi:MAG: DUF4403 family protein [Chitinispirillales bacterium]|jgi:hypothetical protein|nr:DUF4403 family protein [Chitinispirillales bacterium]
MRVTTAIIIIFLISVCAGCAGRSGASFDGAGGHETPAYANREAPPPPVPSTLNIPVEIKTAIIENLVQNLLGETFHKSDTTILGGFTNIKISARRNGPVKITARGDELACSLPVMVTVRLSTTISAMGLTHTEHQDIEAGIALNLRSRVSLKNNWRPLTTTSAAGYRWTTEPVLKARFITVPIKPIANYFADKLMEIICPIIDQALAKSDVIRTSVITPLWEQLYTPISFTVPETQETVWMRFNPTGLYLSNLNGHGASISAFVGIRAVTEAAMGDIPKKRVPAPLPDFTEPPKGGDSAFVINLYAEVPYTNATALCKERFNGKTFASGIHKVTVNDIEVTGATANGLLLIKMNLSGSIKGIVQVTGRVTYNSGDKTLSLSDFNLDMATSGQYQKAKNRLLKGIIINKMKPLIKFPLSAILDADMLTKTLLTDYPIQKKVVLNGRIETLTLRGVETTETALRATVLASGTAKITVTGK